MKKARTEVHAVILLVFFITTETQRLCHHGSTTLKLSLTVALRTTSSDSFAPNRLRPDVLVTTRAIC